MSERMAICHICEVPVEEVHYGIFCCRACAAFFRRTVSHKLSYVCRYQQRCDVSNKKRFSCRACRYQKCLMWGMQKEKVNAVHYVAADGDAEEAASNEEAGTSDRRYNIETICETVDRLPSSVIHKTIQSILKERIGNIFKHQEPFRNQESAFPLSLCQQGLLGFREHNQRWPGCSDENLTAKKPFEKIDIEDFMRDVYKECEYVALFLMHIDVFARLPADRKWIMYKRFYPRFYVLERTNAAAKIPEENVENLSVTYTGLRFRIGDEFTNQELFTDVSQDELKECFSTTQTKIWKMFICPLKRLKPNDFEMVYVLLSSLFGFNKQEMSLLDRTTLMIAEVAKQRISEELHQYYIYEMNQNNYADRVHKMSNLVNSLDRIHEYRQEDMHFSRTFGLFKNDMFMDELLGL